MFMPEVVILKPHSSYKDKMIKGENFTLSGLNFKVCYWGNARVQPMKRSQIDKLLNDYDFKGEFHNNATNKNILYLEENKEGSFKRYKKLI